MRKKDIKAASYLITFAIIWSIISFIIDYWYIFLAVFIVFSIIGRNKSENKNKDIRSRYIKSSVKQYVWRRDGGCCVMCGSKSRLEYDHIIPFSKGGSNTERNIQLLCESCNRQKSSKIR